MLSLGSPAFSISLVELEAISVVSCSGLLTQLTKLKLVGGTTSGNLLRASGCSPCAVYVLVGSPVARLHLIAGSM